MSEKHSGMRRTRWSDLVLIAVVVGVLAYLLVRLAYDSLPPLNYSLPVPLAALAIVEFVVARRVRAAVRHDPRAKPMTAIAIARCVALGKASSAVGAGVVGAAVGLVARLIPDVADIRAAAHDAQIGVLVLAAGLLVIAAGLLLERAGIDPGQQS